MLIKLLRNARIAHQAGEVIEVTDPALVQFLVSTQSAVIVKGDTASTPEAEATKPETRKRTASKRKSS